MSNKKRLVDAELYGEFLHQYAQDLFGMDAPMIAGAVERCLQKLNEQPAVDAVKLPCKIGDYVWAIRNYKGHIHPNCGIVRDMYFTKGMKLQIAVKNVGRGEWGKTVFPTRAEAEKAIEEKKKSRK